jgi:predicted dehydrogenase
VLLLEAYATPFHPRTRALDALVRSGRLGPLRFGRATFTFPLGRPDDHRWRPELAAGALHDVGIYCLAPLLAAAGRPPVRVAATATRTPSGVHAAFSGWLDFGDGFAATIECAFDAPERQALEIVGAEAGVSVDRAHTPGLPDTRFVLRHRDGREDVVETASTDPHRRLLAHTGAVIRGSEAPAWPATASVALLACMDRLRAAADGTGSP